MEINQAGLDLLKQFEGCKLQAYKDIVGIWTIGYGHTGDDVVPGLEISQDDADELLRQDICQFEDGVSDLLTVQVNDNQFSALVCFAYNVGLKNLRTSLLLRCLNKNNFKDASTQFIRWNHAGGQVTPGLTRRRLAERDLFLTEE